MARSEARAGDPDFPDDTARHRSAMTVEQVDARVRERRAERQRITRVFGCVMHQHADRGFGGTVVVDDAQRRYAGADRADKIRAQRFAAADEHAPRQDLAQMRAQRAQMRRHHLGHIRRMACQERGEQRRIEQRCGVGKEQRGAAGEGGEDRGVAEKCASSAERCAYEASAGSRRSSNASV